MNEIKKYYFQVKIRLFQEVCKRILKKFPSVYQPFTTIDKKKYPKQF
jgi:hypothetical protein